MSNTFSEGRVERGNIPFSEFTALLRALYIQMARPPFTMIKLLESICVIALARFLYGTAVELKVVLLLLFTATTPPILVRGETFYEGLVQIGLVHYRVR